MEPVSTKEEAQVKEEPQYSIFISTGVNNQATASVENDDQALVGENTTVPATLV